MRIVAAMSGGVDSSVAAALLAEEGHDVVGLSMQLYDQREGGEQFGSCCTLDDLHDARRVAARLGIPHYIVNFERQFDEHVVSNFVRDYVAARTPIPCVRCNGDLKFTTLLGRARGLDAEAVATGHYAQVERSADGAYLLKRGVDRAKDQSYFLFTLTQAQLARARFPLGARSKPEVRAYAETRRLPVARKPDSHEICFVPDGDHAAFIERRAPDAVRPGRIVDAAGRTLGRHAGVHRFTVGQRRGLGVGGLDEPHYVTGIDADSGRVTVGPKAALRVPGLLATDVTWVAGNAPATVRVAAKIRYRSRPLPATVVGVGGRRAEVRFDEAHPAVTPGQAVVFYDGARVLGGGWIEGPLSETARHAG